MAYTPKYPAAFINTIADEGTKAEAIEWLQRTWDDYIDCTKEIIELRAKVIELEKDIQTLIKL